jgi:hypothetical protein
MIYNYFYIFSNYNDKNNMNLIYILMLFITKFKSFIHK